MDGDVKTLLRLGEDSVCEFKSMRISGKRVVEPDAREVADEMAAVANTIGATFLFGVNDKTHEVEGVPESKLEIAETWLRTILNDSIKPALFATIRKILVPDSTGSDRCLIRVDVPKSLFVHESPHGYFYRIGSSKRKMSPEMLARLFQQRSQTRLVCFDEQVVSQAEAGELLAPLYTRFRTELSSADDDKFLRKLHFVAPDVDGVMRPTVAGVLFATEHPESYLPSAFIQAVCYRGVERNADYQLDARDITGPLDVQIDEACRFVERNMRIAAIKNPARIDIPQYAMNAVFEAVVNAVAHRDYSISGSKIRLHMFADRLEIFSPGGLPNSMALDEIGERQFARNELICTCLSRCPVRKRFAEIKRERIMDKRGEGVPVILSASDRLSGKFPEYKLLGESELLLTIHSAPIDDRKKLRELITSSGETINSGRKTIRGAGETIKSGNGMISKVGEAVIHVAEAMDETINETIKSNPGISLIGIVEKVGRSRATVARVVAALKKEGCVEYRGSKKTGGYFSVS